MSRNIHIPKGCRNFKMYIAFKWLLGLTFVMWIAMCSIDILIRKNTQINNEGFTIRPLVKNRTLPERNKYHFQTHKFVHRIRDKQGRMMYLHIVMFLAGALVVLLYKRINKIYSLTIQELSTLYTTANNKRLKENLKAFVLEVNKIVISVYEVILKHSETVVCKLPNVIRVILIKVLQKPRINNLLLKKIKELGDERNNLAELLVAAVHENKNLRMQFQLETMAKSRLMQHVESTQKLIKENRSRYVSFQQLYLVTHQENIFLKSRLKKLTKEKDEAATNLLELVNEVYKSKNNDLRAYCSRFIVKGKENLLNSDVGAEIHAFLNGKSQMTNIRTPRCSLLDLNHDDSHKSCQSCSNSSEITEVLGISSILPFYAEVPKLKGLPGEYVWTVKDKDGLIEKLYEYDCEPDFENGDTIRRIREYSVYFDKDCLLDFSNSSTVINDGSTTQSSKFCCKSTLDFPLTSQNFLTGSEAFQKFMEKNTNVVSTSILPVSRVKY